MKQHNLFTGDIDDMSKKEEPTKDPNFDQKHVEFNGIYLKVKGETSTHITIEMENGIDITYNKEKIKLNKN